MAEEVQPASQDPITVPISAPAVAPVPPPAPVEEADEPFDIDAQMAAFEAAQGDAPAETPAVTEPVVIEPAPQAIVSPAPPKSHSLHLRVAARRLGASDAEIDSVSADQLEAFIAANVGAAPQAAKPVENDDPFADVDFGTDPTTGAKLTAEAYLDPKLAKILRDERTARKALEKKLADQETAATRTAAQQQAAQTRAAAAPIDAAFAKVAATHKALFSAATIGSVPPDEFKRREDVLAAARVMPGATFEEKIANAVKAIHGEGDVKTQKAIELRKKQWATAGVAKPTDRAGSQEPRGDSRARQTVKNFFANLAKANGNAAEQNGDLDLESLPD